MKFLPILILLFSINAFSQKIITSDIDNFWNAYDKIHSTKDTLLQKKYLEDLFLNKGTPGLKAIMEVRNYTPQEYLNAINNYPKFWNSIRKNTLKADKFNLELNEGIEKLRKIYPELKPAKIYFTIGVFRTSGTTLDNIVLIGSEYAMGDKNAVTDEFPENVKTDRQNLFDTNPIENLVLLNVHEYVHTQQKPQAHNLLSEVLREGVAEFVSVQAMGIPSSAPAIDYGKQNDEVRKKFEQEMFFGHNMDEWLWSNANENDFGVRDLGYYIGYQICELYYNNANDKQTAIKKMIELDYTNESEIEEFVNSTKFFSASLEELYQQFEAKRPTVVGMSPFENNDNSVYPNTTQITIQFSEPMDTNVTNFELGPLGIEALCRIKKVVGFSEDRKSITLELEPLQPNKRYQIVVDWGFRNLEKVPLKSYLIDFTTSK